MLTVIYRIYQLLIVVPIGLTATLLTALCTILGCALGGNRFWGYYPGKLWSMLLIRLFLLPVKVKGKEKLKDGQSYVFCPNHQGSFDIFLIHGFLGHNFKWVMKQSLRSIPFVGKACESAGFIFIDKSGPNKIKESIQKAEKNLSDGISVVIFPEGSRTSDGKLTKYRRGAFIMADDLQLPVVPITINGSFNVKPRTKDLYWVFWHPLELVIHDPIMPIGKGNENILYLEKEAFEKTESALI